MILLYIFRKLLDKLPTFMKFCRMERKNLYVVTEAYEVSKDTMLTGLSSVNLLVKGFFKQLFKVQQDGDKKASSASVLLLLRGFWGSLSRGHKDGVIIFHCSFVVYA